MKNILKHIRAFLRYYQEVGLHFQSTIQYFYLNYFSRNINSCIPNECYIIPHQNCVLEFQKNSKIILHSVMRLGIPTIKGGKKESRLLMRKNSTIEVNDNVDISDGFDIQIQENGHLIFGKFHSNTELEISCGNIIELNGQVVCGRHVRIKDFNGHLVTTSKYPLSAPIRIANHVWLCTGSTVNPGVTINEGCVIADNSNVIANIPSYSFAQGNPAKVVEHNINFSL